MVHQLPKHHCLCSLGTRAVCQTLHHGGPPGELGLRYLASSCLPLLSPPETAGNSPQGPGRLTEACPCPQLRSWMYAVYGVLAVVGTMGPWYLLLLLGHCVGLYVASLLGQPWLCLALGLASLASFKMDPLISWQVQRMEG